MIEGHNLVLDKSQVMHRIKHNIRRVIRTGVVGNHLCCATDDDAVDKAFDPDLTMSVGDRH